MLWYLLYVWWAEAVADANKAIELDPSSAKAYLRKGWVIWVLKNVLAILKFPVTHAMHEKVNSACVCNLLSRLYHITENKFIKYVVVLHLVY